MALSFKLLEGTSATVSGAEIAVKGALGENRRAFNSSLLGVSVGQEGITITPTESKVLNKKAVKAAGALSKEIRNDMQGVTKYFEIKMQSVHAHFPLTVEVKGDMIVIKNMVGERAARQARIMGGTKVEIKGQNVRIYGIKLDDVTQTAANVRKASKIRNKDERVFQDGVYYALEE